jgi:hypothetical protein
LVVEVVAVVEVVRVVEVIEVIGLIEVEAIVGSFRGSQRSARRGSARCFGGELREGQQRDADVSQPLEQPVQCGLIGDRASQDGGAVVRVGEAHPVEPSRPSGGQVPLDSELVLHERNVRTDLVRPPHHIW